MPSPKARRALSAQGRGRQHVWGPWRSPSHDCASSPSMEPDRIKPFVSCLLGRLKENRGSPRRGHRQARLCAPLINQLAHGEERREGHVINTCFSLASFTSKDRACMDPQESSPPHPRHMRNPPPMPAPRDLCLIWGSLEKCSELVLTPHSLPSASLDPSQSAG